jgi:hypothetical protein
VVDHALDLGPAALRNDRAEQCDVDDGLATHNVDLGQQPLDGVDRTRAVERHLDDRGDAARRGGCRARDDTLTAVGEAMHMRIDHARQHESLAEVVALLDIGRADVARDRDDPLAFDHHLAPAERPVVGDQIADDRA